MSSSRLSAFANRRPPAKTEKLGFLHLPDEARKRICELAIFDHDRGLVLLPRALPRTPLAWEDEDEDFSDHIAASCLRNPGEPPLDFDTMDSHDPAEGCWVNGDSADDTCSEGYCSSEVSDSDSDRTAQENTSGLYDYLDEEKADSEGVDEACTKCVMKWEEDIDECCPDECECDCHETPVEAVSDVESEPCVAPPDRCFTGECIDEACKHCAGNGLLSDSFEEAYVNDPEGDFEAQREEEWGPEDEYHLDVDEKVGVLYEANEPAILLASTEIRAQCLPIYYSNNAFSWRMFWLDYPGSLKSFQKWAQTVAGVHAKHITKLSLEGRHVVEEGTEFAVDIDLLETAPYFHVALKHEGDAHDVWCAEALHKELSLELRVIAARSQHRPTFTAEDLCALGAIFVKVMHWECGSILPPPDKRMFGDYMPDLFDATCPLHDSDAPEEPTERAASQEL
ncbi:hypothetical protein LTR15_007805 [Elasticomyces elasticus]|nr:hypothetical protein LTR15_007805 [Elasticomyces elasticus]